MPGPPPAQPPPIPQPRVLPPSPSMATTPSRPVDEDAAVHDVRTELDEYDANVAKEASKRDNASISLLIRALLDASERRARDDAWAEAIIRDAVACYAGEDGKWGLREWRCFCRDLRLEEPTPAPELIWLTVHHKVATSGGGDALTRVVRAGISEERADAMQVVELVEALSAAHLAARSLTEDVDQFTWRLLAPCAARFRNGGGPGDARKLGACDGRTLDVILESLPALWVLFGAYARDGRNRRAPQDFLDAFPLSARFAASCCLASSAAMASNPHRPRSRRRPPRARATATPPSRGNYEGMASPPPTTRCR